MINSHDYDFISFGLPEWGNTLGFGPLTFVPPKEEDNSYEDNSYLDGEYDTTWEDEGWDLNTGDDDLWDDIMALETGLI